MLSRRGKLFYDSRARLLLRITNSSLFIYATKVSDGTTTEVFSSSAYAFSSSLSLAPVSMPVGVDTQTAGV